MQLLKISLVVFSIFLSSCGTKPKVIVEDTSTTTNPTNSEASSTPNKSTETGTMANDMHQVTALEILQAERYTYLKVVEKSDTFWIASTKMQPKVGNTYFYRGGLLKTNFESQEHKRTFDKIYLVASIMDAAAHPGGGAETPVASNAPIHNHDISAVAGSIKLSDLMKTKEKQKGKMVIVAGRVVKANYGILGKNWYHIQDGTKLGGRNCDLTITSTENIPIDANVAFQGKIELNKDFGAGYKYDIIMEDGKFK